MHFDSASGALQVFWPSADITHYSLGFAKTCVVGGKAPLRPRQLTLAKSTERSGLGARSRPLSPCPPGPRGQGRSAPHRPPSHWQTGAGARPGLAGARVPVSPWLFFKLVGQAPGGQLQAVHGGRVSLGERWESAPWPGPPRGRVVHAPAGGGGQGHFSTAGAGATPPPLRPASQAGSESVSLRSQTHLRSLEGSKKKPNDFNDLGGGVCSPWMSRGLLTLDEQGCNVCCRSANISSS